MKLFLFIFSLIICAGLFSAALYACITTYGATWTVLTYVGGTIASIGATTFASKF